MCILILEVLQNNGGIPIVFICGAYSKKVFKEGRSAFGIWWNESHPWNRSQLVHRECQQTSIAAEILVRETPNLLIDLI